jgi:hypothetical protein
VGLIGGARDEGPRESSRREHSVWARLMAPGEQVQEVVRLSRTVLVFTGRRLVLVEEAPTGRKVDYVSVPYRSITAFAVEATGIFAADADLRIWVAGRTSPIEKSFTADVDVYAVQALLAAHLSG